LEEGTLHARARTVMTTPRTATSGPVQRIFNYGLARGVDHRHMSRDNGLQHAELKVPDSRVPIDRVFGLWTRLAHTLHDPALPIRVAETANLADLHILGFAIQASPHLREGLQTFLRFASLLTTSGRWSARHVGRRFELIWQQASPPTLGVRLSDETALAQVVGSLRQMAGADLEPLEVWFRHPAPEDVAHHNKFFRCRVRFDAKESGVAIDDDLLDAGSPWANRALWEYLCSDAAQRTERVVSHRFVDMVNEAIARGLRGEASRLPSVTEVANALGTTERTLRRRLELEATTFRVLTEAARRERVRQLLGSDDVSITRGRVRIGLSDASALTHACKRWFGRPPRELRSGTGER
jgi:AraC-like DNA-binding protein